LPELAEPTPLTRQANGHQQQQAQAGGEGAAVQERTRPIDGVGQVGRHHAL